MVRSGHPEKQAIAAAFSNAGRAKGGNDSGMDFLQNLKGFFRNFVDWISEEEGEGEHATDALPEATARAAGVALITPAGKILFLKRGDQGDHPGTWCFPGGGCEEGEMPEQTAIRETHEEIGDCALDSMSEFDDQVDNDGHGFTTFIQPVAEDFKPMLNDEHTEAKWCGLDELPEPLHPGVKGTIDRALKAAHDVMFKKVPGGTSPTVNLTPLLKREAKLTDVTPQQLQEQKNQPVVNTAQDEWSDEARAAAAEARKNHSAALEKRGWKAVKQNGETSLHRNKAHPGYTITHSGNGDWQHHKVTPTRQKIKLGSGWGVRQELGAHLDKFHGRKAGDAHDAVDPTGKLSKTTRTDIDSTQHREDMPEDAFLLPASRKYPVKEKEDGVWKYTRNLLLAASRRARMEGRADLASRADSIRAREFGAESKLSGAQDTVLAMDWRGCSALGDVGGTAIEMAFDRDTKREYDEDGRLHVKRSVIAKACVSPYWGREIPEYEELGLDPNKEYKLYRDPNELAKSVETFNRLPIVDSHKEIDANNHAANSRLVIGATGDSAEFEAPYLYNNLVFWPKEAIKEIETNKKRELSPGYRFKAVMTPGTTPEGERFDGRMTRIKGSHLAKVEQGRQGKDVTVGDATPVSRSRSSWLSLYP